MRRCVVFFCMLLAGAAAATPLAERPAEFLPGNYQDSAGALMLNVGGDWVEPYMGTKALLVAQDAGLDIRYAASRWIAWMLAHQRRDGRFERYCRKNGSAWRACRPADADDSMQALWLQLLYRLAPDSGIPPEWQDSVRRAQAQLFSLRNRRWGVYRIARNNHVGLFMDNVEVYAALKDIARAQRRFGDAAAAAENDRRADELADAMQHIFWDKRARMYFASTQRTRHQSFYPDAVAQTYPWLNDLPTVEGDVRAGWKAWLEAHGADWLSRRSVSEPWGLVALTALHLQDSDTAACWLLRAAPQHNGLSWDILEEAAFQAIAARLPNPHSSACAALLARR